MSPDEKPTDLSASKEHYLAAAISYLQIGYAWDALNILDRLESQDNKDTLIKQAKAVAYVELGEWELFEKKLREILEIEPRNRFARSALEWIK